MSIQPKSTVTFGSELSYLNSLLKNYSGQNLGLETALLIYNRIIAQIYTEIANTESEDYKERYSFPKYKSYYHQTTTDVNYNYNHAYRILTLSKTGATWANDKDNKFDNEWVGAQVILLVDPGGDDQQYITEVESIYSDTQVILKLIDPAIPTISSTTLQVSINTSNSLNKLSELDLSEIEDFKYLDNILSISSDVAQCQKKEIDEFNNLVKSPLYLFSSYAETILWSKETQKLYFAKGTLANYGNRILHYKRKLMPLSSEASYIDLPIEHHNVMTARATRRAFQHVNKVIPEFLSKDDIDFSNSKKANKEERILQLQKDTKQIK